MVEDDHASATERRDHVVLRPARAQPSLAPGMPGWLARRGFGPWAKMRIAAGMSAAKPRSRTLPATADADPPNRNAAVQAERPNADNIVELRAYRRPAAA